MTDHDELGAGPRDPEELEAAGVVAVQQIPAGTRMGAVDLTVADLDRSVGFYTRDIGLQVLRREPGLAALGAGRQPLLVLVEEPGARPGRASPACTTSPCWWRTVLISPAGSRTRRASAWRSPGPPTTSSARRCTWTTPTATASRSTGTAL